MVLWLTQHDTISTVSRCERKSIKPFCFEILVVCQIYQCRESHSLAQARPIDALHLMKSTWKVRNPRATYYKICEMIEYTQDNVNIHFTLYANTARVMQVASMFP